MRQIFYIILFFVTLSFLFNQGKLKFSADIAKSYKDNDILAKEFKNNVKIIDGDIMLHANSAIHYPDSNKVILIGDVRMYEHDDSLKCKQLHLYKGNNERYEATGSVILYKQNQEIKAEHLIYFGNNNIEAQQNVSIKDSLRLILGDSLYINYIDSLINTIHIKSNAKLYNTRSVLIKGDSNKKNLEDILESNNMYIDFYDNETVKNINLYGMAIADFSIVEDSLLKGHNNISGDSISIQYQNEKISNMKILGGAIGKFVPDSDNDEISNEVYYEANLVDYNVDKEITILNNNAKVIYGTTTLEGGEIEANWNLNIIESRIKESVIPLVSTNNESPTYGEYMIFDLVTERGNIDHGYNQIEMGIFKGDEFLTDTNNDVYIEKGMFTSCDLETPHYYFGSKNMKIVEEKDQILVRPMILYIQDFPALTLPFAILPNSSKNRKSGFIMPSFGHSSKNGTWIEDFGYYFAPNDYYDITSYLDFYDKKKVQIDARARYKKQNGENWYNYNLYGDIYIAKYTKELIDNNGTTITNVNDPQENPYQDFVNLNSKSGISEKNYSIDFNHYQEFDPTQRIHIQYEFDNFDNFTDVDMLTENNPTLYLDQTEYSSFNYSKRWQYSSITIGGSLERDLTIPEPETVGEIYSNYKTVNKPTLTYNFNKPKIFGEGDKWYHKTIFSYNSSFHDQSLSYSKKSVLNENRECCQWAEDDIEIITKNPGAFHKTTFQLPFKLSWLNITPDISIYEHWVLSENLNQIIGRKIYGRTGLDLSTKIYGIIPLKSKKIVAVSHIITPTITTSYTSKNHFIKGSYVNFNAPSSNQSQAYTDFSLNNFFEAKVLNEENQYSYRDLLSCFFTTGYNWHSKLFSPLSTTLGFKNKYGGEYLRIYMQHSFYINDNSNELIDFSKGKFPRLTSLTTTLSRNFNYNIYGDSFESNSNLDTINNNYSSNIDTTLNNFDTNHSVNNKVWDLSFGITLTADYNLEDKWNLEYSKLLLNSNIYL